MPYVAPRSSTTLRSLVLMGSSALAVPPPPSGCSIAADAGPIDAATSDTAVDAILDSSMDSPDSGVADVLDASTSDATTADADASLGPDDGSSTDAAGAADGGGSSGCSSSGRIPGVGASWWALIALAACSRRRVERR